MPNDKVPLIIFVHGAWHTPACWDVCRSRLEASGYKVIARQSPSASLDPKTIGHTLADDVNPVRDDIRAAAEAGQDVVLVGHSYGGFIITEAAHGLAKGELDLPGGVVQLVYICAFAPEVGPDPWAGTPENVNPPWVTPVVSVPLSSFASSSVLPTSCSATSHTRRSPRAPSGYSLNSSTARPSEPPSRLRRSPAHLLQRPSP